MVFASDVSDPTRVMSEATMHTHPGLFQRLTEPYFVESDDFARCRQVKRFKQIIASVWRP